MTVLGSRAACRVCRAHRAGTPPGVCRAPGGVRGGPAHGTLAAPPSAAGRPSPETADRGGRVRASSARAEYTHRAGRGRKCGDGLGARGGQSTRRSCAANHAAQRSLAPHAPAGRASRGASYSPRTDVQSRNGIPNPAQPRRFPMNPPESTTLATAPARRCGGRVVERDEVARRWPRTRPAIGAPLGPHRVPWRALSPAVGERRGFVRLPSPALGSRIALAAGLEPDWSRLGRRLRNVRRERLRAHDDHGRRCRLGDTPEELRIQPTAAPQRFAHRLELSVEGLDRGEEATRLKTLLMTCDCPADGFEGAQDPLERPSLNTHTKKLSRPEANSRPVRRPPRSPSVAGNKHGARGAKGSVA